MTECLLIKIAFAWQYVFSRRTRVFFRENTSVDEFQLLCLPSHTLDRRDVLIVESKRVLDRTVARRSKAADVPRTSPKFRVRPGGVTVSQICSIRAPRWPAVTSHPALCSVVLFGVSVVSPCSSVSSSRETDGTVPVPN